MAARPTEMQREAIARLRELLATDTAAARQALVELYELQTEEEQRGEHPDIHNGVGFSRYDADILSDFARMVQRGYMLSPRQMQIAHDRLPKYAGQLVRLGLVIEGADEVAA